MKKFLTLALLACLSVSCVSYQMRDEVLLPAASLAWGTSESGVRSDLERGIADAVEDGDLENSFELDSLVIQLDEVLSLGGSRFLLRQIPWTTLRPYAVRGIQDRVDDGEISQMVADLSYIERLNRFSMAIRKLLVAHSFKPTRESNYPSLPGIGRTTSHAAIASLR